MLWFSRSHYTCLKDWSCQSLHTNTLTTLVYFCISCTNTVESWCLAILLLITSAKKHRKSTRIWLNYCILPAGIKNKGHTEEKAIQRILYHREQVRRDNHIQASQPTLYFQHFFFFLLPIYIKDFELVNVKLATHSVLLSSVPPHSISYTSVLTHTVIKPQS